MVSPPTISVNEDQETSFTTNSFEQFYNNPTLNIDLGGDDSTLRINVSRDFRLLITRNIQIK